MALFSFGDYSQEHGYKILDEREVRGSAGVMLLLGAIASINGFILREFLIIPYIAGFLVLSFAIGLFVHPRLAPTMLVARVLTWRQAPQPIGAVQKKFSWSLGLALSVAIFVLSIFLQSDPTLFEPVCLLCLICLLFLFLESAFGICVGCQIYSLGVRWKIIEAPGIAPNCVGDSCEPR